MDEKVLLSTAKEFGIDISTAKSRVQIGRALINALNPAEGEKEYTDEQVDAMKVAAWYNLHFEDKEQKEYDEFLASMTA